MTRRAPRSSLHCSFEVDSGCSGRTSAAVELVVGASYFHAMPALVSAETECLERGLGHMSASQPGFLDFESAAVNWGEEGCPRDAGCSGEWFAEAAAADSDSASPAARPSGLAAAFDLAVAYACFPAGPYEDSLDPAVSSGHHKGTSYPDSMRRACQAVEVPCAAPAFVATAPDSAVVLDRNHKQCSLYMLGSERHHSHTLAMTVNLMVERCCADPLAESASCESAVGRFVGARSQNGSAVTVNQT